MSIASALIVISMAVAIFGSLSDTTKKGLAFPRNVTWVGWLLVGLAVLTAVFSFWENREKASAEAIQENIALRQAETAIYLLLTPYVAISDPPEVSDRFKVVEAYGAADVFKGLCDVDITSQVSRSFIRNESQTIAWGEFITEKTRAGLNQLNAVQAAQGSLLSDETNMLIGRVISHPWNEFLLASAQRVNSAPDKPRALCSEKPALRKGYEDLSDEYWKILRDLERAVGRRHCELREKLGTKDAPPLFLRMISGMIYIPDTKENDLVMDQICVEVFSS